ncbi:hypothetical protein LBMAG53_32330 [Planctomycetota bacterium]|nr:hypothetical protein LBMAG53_32330 [Planctomycetota bacterium]
MALVLAGCTGQPTSTNELARYTVVRKDLLVTISETGSLKSAKPAPVVLRVNGTVVKAVKEGSVVKKGEVVLELQNKGLTANHDGAVLDVESAQRDLAAAQAELRLHALEADKQLADAERALRFAKLAQEHFEKGKDPLRREELALAERRAGIERDDAAEKAERMPGLLAKGFVTAAEVRTASLEADEKRTQAARKKRELEIYQTYEAPQEQAKLAADVIAAELGVERIKQQIATQRGQKEAAVRTAEVRIARKKAESEDFAGQLALLTLVAPTDGVVVYGKPDRREWEDAPTLQPGEDVGQNQTVMNIPDLNEVVVEVGINQIHVGRVAVGQTATVTVDGVNGKVLHGAIQKLANTPSPRGWGDDLKRFSTTISLTDAAGVAFKPGMDAKVEIQVDKRTQVLAVPVNAVLTRAGVSHCWVATPTGRERRTVKLGPASNDQVEIGDGLKEGDVVLVYAVEPGGDG